MAAFSPLVLVVPAGDSELRAASNVASADVVQRRGNELKLVWPQYGIDPTELETWQFDHFLVQPMDCERREEALQAAIRLAMDRPKWRLSLQAHKVVGLP